MSDMLTPYTQNDDTTVTFPDDEGQLSVSVWVTPDGADDTPEWARDARHVQIDTNDGTYRGIVVHLNDGPPIYQGNPDVHESAAEVLRQVGDILTSPDYSMDSGRVHAAREVIRTSGVVL